MKMVRSLLVSLPLLGLAAFHAGDAEACGGCAVPVGEDTQVTGHRMIFATSKTQTSLYDQIEYSGAPEDFVWFLPIKGEVEVKLSSDVLFAFFGQASSPQVLPPPLNCPQPPSGCYDYAAEADGAGSGGDGGGSANGGVEVWSQEVVGPYETVQIKGNSPAVVLSWFDEHGYSVPDDIKPVITAYQQEGFAFLAMQLQPGEGVNAMQPVRVTAPGASLGMPLRMVAAGTGVLTPITLFVVGEGRYETDNFPNLVFDPTPIVFHWDDYTSNYDQLLKGLFQSSNGFGWLTQSAGRYSKYNLVSQVQQVIDFNPGQSGWGTTDLGEMEHAMQDLEALFAGMDEQSIWLTRLHAQLQRPALANDLMLRAEASQAEVSRFIQAKYSDGNAPSCPDYSWCAEDSNAGGEWIGVGGDNDGDLVKGKGKCSVERAGQSDGPAGLLAALGLAAAAVVVRRRRRG